MHDLSDRLRALDHLESPDLWPTVAQREPDQPDPRFDQRASRLRRSATLALAAVLLAGAGAGIWAGAVDHARTPDSRRGATYVTSRALSRSASARREAEHLLHLLRLPPGSEFSSSAPPGSGSLLRSPFELPATPDVVDLAHYFIVPMAPEAAISWIKGHLPGGGTASQSGTSSDGGRTVLWELAISWPASGPVTGIFGWRSLVIELAALPESRAALRVDSEVTWLPEKNAADRVPGGVKVLVATVPGFPGGSAPVTTHSLAVIDKLRAAVNHLPVELPGTASCAADLAGGLVELVFRAAQSGPPVAVVHADKFGCGAVGVTVNGKRGLTLIGGRTIVALAVRLLGIKVASGP